MPLLSAVQGTIHQGSLSRLGLSSSNGTQCTAIALVALIFAVSYSPTEWVNSDLNNIVIEGDRVYQRIVTGHFGGDSARLLAHEDVPQVVNVFQTDLQFNVLHTFYGIADGSRPSRDTGAHSLRDAVYQSLALSHFVLATFRDLTICILQNENGYFLFDSHARNWLGQVDPDGAATLLHFSDLLSLWEYLHEIYYNYQFNISPVTFVELGSDTGQSNSARNEPELRGDSFIIGNNTLGLQSASCEPGLSVESCDSNNQNLMQQHFSLNHTYSCDSGRARKKGSKTQQKKADNLVSTLINRGHSNEQKYEEYIQGGPDWSCSSCHRILFKNQVRRITAKHTTDLMQSIGISADSVVCCTCYNYFIKQKVPAICSYLNNLFIDEFPEEMTCLGKLEKKLLATIQVFFTMIILPGGQFAEKGMVLNLPRDIQPFVNDILNVGDLNSMCVVKFEAGSPSGHSANFIVNPQKILRAITWLKCNNRLYQQIALPDMCAETSNRIDLDIVNVEDTMNVVNSLENITMTPVNYSVSANQSIEKLCSAVPDQTYHSITVSRISDSPVNVYDLPCGEESAFPWLFPKGRYGFNYPRNYKLSPSMYFKYRLYNKAAVWRKDIMYLLHAAVSYDVMLLKQEINIYMKMRKTVGSIHGQASEPLTVSDIRNAHENPDIVKNSYMFMKNIRGTVAYFRNALYDLLAMFRSLGPPTLFMTLSADDLHWPELGMLLEHMTYEDAVKKGSFTSSMRDDPLLTATHFDRRFSALLKFVILDGPMPLGKVVDYFVRVEFQLRGSPHFHLFFWIEQFCTEVQPQPDILCSYINSTIKTDLPLEQEDKRLFDLVNRLQTHSHTKYCMPYSRPPCRFGFPKHVCSRTRLLTTISALTNKGKFYETKRSSNSVNINAYNPVILSHWRANMDIQMINSAEGAAYYVCHYLCKSEPDELKVALTNMISTVFTQNPNMPAFQRLWNIGTCVLKHRRMTAQEAAYRLSNLKLIQSTRTVVYINSRPLDKRFKLLKPQQELRDLGPDCQDVFQLNIIDYYYARPVHMEDISLYFFASWYIKCPRPADTQSVSTRRHERIFISGPDIWMRKRGRAAVIRYPTFSVTTDDYYYSLLMLLLPHRDESNIMGDYGSARDAFVAQNSRFNTSVILHKNFLVDVENAMRRIYLAEAELHPATIFNEESADSEESSIVPFSTAVSGISQTESVPDFEEDIHHYHEINVCIYSRSEFEIACAGLTSCQKKALNYIHSYFAGSKSKPLYLFITGGGGVGKSFLLKMIVAYLQLNQPVLSGVNPVKLCAPTGTAARNIHGSTIHSLLRIPVDKYMQYSSLTAYHLQQLRSLFAGVHTLVIDEISMVSDRMLTFISRRLSEISGNTCPFGHFNIITVGDFFQLRPVKGTYAFNNQLLWDLFTPIFLRENVRQSGNTRYVELLNRARVGLLTPDDIQCLKTRLKVIEHESCLKTFSLHIYPTREAVKNHNTFCESFLAGHKVVVHAEHFFSQKDREPGAVAGENFIPNDDRDAGNIPAELCISIGSRVMLIRNVDASIGLVNGAVGLVSSLVRDSTTNLVSSIYVLFDDNSVGFSQGQRLSNHVPISVLPFEHEYIMNGRSVIRRNFPLILSWASTVHKVQGMTLNMATIDLGSTVFQHGMAYVALSRVQSLDGLNLIAFNPTVITPCNEVLIQYEKLRSKQI